MNMVWVHVHERADAPQIQQRAHELETRPLVNLKMILMVEVVHGLWVQILALALVIIPLVMLILLVIQITLVIAIPSVMGEEMVLTVLLNHNAHTILVLVFALAITLLHVLVIIQFILVLVIITQVTVQERMVLHVTVLLLVDDM